MNHGPFGKNVFYGCAGREGGPGDRGQPRDRGGDRPAVRRGGGGRGGGGAHHGRHACRLSGHHRPDRGRDQRGGRHGGGDRGRPVPAGGAGAAGRGDHPRGSGAPDILVSNAAVTYFTRVEDFTAKRYALMFAVQVEAPFHLATLVLPGMRARGTGWILNISSVAARHPAVPSTPGRAAAAPCTGCARRRSSGSPPAWPPSCTRTTSRSTRCPRPGWCRPRARSSIT